MTLLGPKKPSGIVFCTTSPNPRVRASGPDCGQKGWRLHAVYGLPLDSFESLKRSRALCGVRPRHGWGIDLFIEDPCLRCVAKAMSLGIEIPEDIAHRYEVNRISKNDFNKWRKDPDAYNAAHARG